MQGLFITFEGGEGSGKSTQIVEIANWIKAHYPKQEIVITREPGGTVPAEEIRHILVNGDKDKITPQTEALLMIAARTENVHKIIMPALDRGAVILCDRFADSSRVYQALAHGKSIDKIDALHEFGFDNLQPDITFYLDIPPEEGLERATKRISDIADNTESRFEDKGLDFHKRVRDGYLTLASLFPDRFEIINGSQKIDVITDHITQIIAKKVKELHER